MGLIFYPQDTSAFVCTFICFKPSLWNTVDFNYIYLLWNYYISMSVHVHFYCEQSPVTLIQCEQQTKKRLCVETISALLEMHRSWNALPGLNHVQNTPIR